MMAAPLSYDPHGGEEHGGEGPCGAHEAREDHHELEHRARAREAKSLGHGVEGEG